MFQLSADEASHLRSQIGTSKRGRGGLRYLPYVFTEQGVAMLSSVLNSERAVLVNIEIMRAFVKLRQLLASNTELSHRLDDLESKYDRQFKVVFDAIRELMSPIVPAHKQIGFRFRLIFEMTIQFSQVSKSSFSKAYKRTMSAIVMWFSSRLSNRTASPALTRPSLSTAK